jgi:hypothetical protein
MLVLCPARTTDRLTIADFMEHAPRIARYLRKRSRIIGTIVEPKRPTGCGPMLSQTLRKLDLCIEAECVAVESALQRLTRLKLRLLCRHKRRPGARRAVCSAAISRLRASRHSRNNARLFDPCVRRTASIAGCRWSISPSARQDQRAASESPRPRAVLRPEIPAQACLPIRPRCVIEKPSGDFRP